MLVVAGISVTMAIQIANAARDTTVKPSVPQLVAIIVMPVAAAFLLMLVDMFWRRKRLQVLSGLFFGALAGMVIAYGLGIVVDVIVQLYNFDAPLVVQLIKGTISAAVIFMCVSFVLQTKDDFRFIIPYVEFSRQTKGTRPMLLDTSAIIDGRIADVVETGVVESELIVPRFVLHELQMVADSSDKLKRTRGRRGLDILAKLQDSSKVDVRIIDPTVPAVDKVSGTDAKLMALASHLDGQLVTTDYNLSKTAQLRGVKVVNMNDIAQAMRPTYLPGESLKVRIIRQGEEAGQGVGYLQDGTMVVVEQASEQIGSDVMVTVTSAIQTSAGRMIFGRCNGQGE